MAACQMLCQWLEDCLASSTSNRPCGIMQTPCLCWDPPPQLNPVDGGCFHNGVYLENCLPSAKESKKDAELTDKMWPDILILPSSGLQLEGESISRLVFRLQTLASSIFALIPLPIPRRTGSVM
uniref:Adhesion G protein-coupled receptor B N-terminal domain-containing protein n=1 Tax=Knipowitschia caucasica TaxID=637954 RepID=A0AAV2MC15_KNICA